MKYPIKYKMISTVFAFGVLTGCGTYVPELHEFYQTPVEARTMIKAIVDQVQCEVKNAVQIAILEDMQIALDPNVIEAEEEAGLLEKGKHLKPRLE
ncbi:MAG: hypothetical protein WBF43_08550 [Methylocella sp.]